MVLRGSKKLKRGDLRWRPKIMRSSFDIVHVDVWLSVVCVSSSQCHVFVCVLSVWPFCHTCCTLLNVSIYPYISF